MKTREAYIEKAKDMLDELNHDIGGLEKAIAEKRDGAVESYRSKLDSLKEKRGLGRKRLAELKDATEDNWDHVKDGTEEVLKDLRNTCDKVMERFAAMK